MVVLVFHGFYISYRGLKINVSPKMSTFANVRYLSEHVCQLLQWYPSGRYSGWVLRVSYSARTWTSGGILAIIDIHDPSGCPFLAPFFTELLYWQKKEEKSQFYREKSFTLLEPKRVPLPICSHGWNWDPTTKCGDRKKNWRYPCFQLAGEFPGYWIKPIYWVLVFGGFTNFLVHKIVCRVFAYFV